MELTLGQLNCLLQTAWLFKCEYCGAEQKEACEKVQDCLLIDQIMTQIKAKKQPEKLTKDK